MTNKHFNNWIMYHEIHRLSRMGFSAQRIANYLVLDSRTVKKQLQMSEQDFEQHLLNTQQRAKILSPYERFISGKLTDFPDTSAAQMHDWLKEFHPGLPDVSSRSVYNFVMFVRQKYNIPFVRITRDYFPVEQLPYGEQAQVDFGEYNMRSPGGGRKKVRFFAMVLSRSRMKYTWFSDQPFTSETVCQAHEKAFAFFDGIPKTIVYDQDRTMLVEENMGDLILTSTFKQYTKSRNFTLHFCRKSDPESKGKIENVIQYVKKNFLYNRPYSDLESLNTEAIAWLGRTANAVAHNYTKKTPDSEFIIEKPFLKPYIPLIIENREHKLYHVRKTNTISYKSNFYTLPVGTYQGPETQVKIKQINNTIEISSLQNELICIHQLSLLSGQTVTNNNHKRDNSKSIEEMMEQIAAGFTNKNLITEYLLLIKKAYPRYTRDHLQAIIKVLPVADSDVKTADESLDFCWKTQLISGYEFEQVFMVFISRLAPVKTERKIMLLDKKNLEKANQTPQKSNIEDYENIINHINQPK